MPFPEEYYLLTPPAVNNNYMAILTKIGAINSTYFHISLKRQIRI